MTFVIIFILFHVDWRKHNFDDFVVTCVCSPSDVIRSANASQGHLDNNGESSNIVRTVHFMLFLSV